ncbi:hypothetical protein PF007_g1426 [Phytophthora fragariae]|uniref:Uncharacterized protein n=1 Tax=Phytophthora fragariae TaxID=53985 RepID=A0A6A3TPX9_9STRA|nr:hypothetical protein PF007_g1426 [Phytophthora fragariae]
MMFGVVNPMLEVMRSKASYVDDISGARNDVGEENKAEKCAVLGTSVAWVNVKSVTEESKPGRNGLLCDGVGVLGAVLVKLLNIWVGVRMRGEEYVNRS